MKSKQKRPIGVTLIALAFLWIGCFGTLFFPFIAVLGGTFALWQLVFGPMVHSELWLKIIAHSLDCIWFALYIAYAVIGFGLWKLKDWARKSVLFIAALGAALGLVAALVYVRPALMAVSTFGYAIFGFGWIAWYLMRPRVQFAFGSWNRFSPAGEWIEPQGFSGRGKLTVGALVVTSVVILFVIPLFFAVNSMMRDSGAYKLTMATAQASPCVVSALGSPLESGWMTTGSIEESTVNGSAQLNIPVKGPKGKGRLDMQGKKFNGSWSIDSLVFTHGTTQSKLVPSDSSCQ